MSNFILRFEYLLFIGIIYFVYLLVTNTQNQLFNHIRERNIVDVVQLLKQLYCNTDRYKTIHITLY